MPLCALMCSPENTVTENCIGDIFYSRSRRFWTTVRKYNPINAQVDGIDYKEVIMKHVSETTTGKDNFFTTGRKSSDDNVFVAKQLNSLSYSILILSRINQNG